MIIVTAPLPAAAVDRNRRSGGGHAWPRCGLRAQPAPPTRRLVDTHHHYYPREIIDAWQGYMNRYSEGRLQPNVANWAPTASLDEMDKSGVGTSILSLASIPGVWFGLERPACAGCRGCATSSRRRWCRIYPGRYGLFACRYRCRMSTAPLGEIAYAFDTLKADGINLSTSFGDRMARRPRLQAGVRGAELAQGGRLLPPLRAQLLRQSEFRRPAGASRISLSTAAAPSPASLLSGSLAAVARHRVAVFAWRRGDADAGRPRRVLHRGPQGHRRKIAPSGRSGRRVQRLYYDTGQRPPGRYRWRAY